MKLRELLETIVTESTLSVDVPNEEWLQDKIDYAKKKGRNEYGVPYMGSTTASVRGTPPKVRVVRLHSLRGMRREQTNVRYNDLKWLMDYMDKNKKLPPMGSSPDSEYLPYIMVAYNGEAWVNEGNHRIMAAYRLGWDTMPIEIRYFDGGERVEDGPMYPGKIGLGNTPKVKEQGVAEARSNPEQNVKLASGMKELIAIYKDISDIENWAISMTGEAKLGINPGVGISEDTPKGIYFYPLDYAVDLARRNKKLPWGDNMPYIQLFQYDRSKEMTKETQVDPARLKQALLQYCPAGLIQQAIDDPEYDDTPYWIIYDCLSRLGKSDETNIVRWNKVLRDLGFTSVVDDGAGWIAPGEPTQGVVLDPRIIKQHKTIKNRKEVSVVTPAKIEQAIFDTMDMELAANRAWQKYDPDGSKLRVAAKEYAKKPDFKPWFGKPGTEEMYDKASSWGRYSARQLSDEAWAWYKEQQAQQPVKQESLEEAPLADYEPLGDFTKPGPFTGADKKLIPHPVNQLKAEQFFSKTPYDIRLFFSNLTGTGKYSEYGVMAPDVLKIIFGDDADKIINGHDDAITVVYVGNKGDSKKMLTPWVMAHRLGHAIQAGVRSKGLGRKDPDHPWTRGEDHFFKAVNSMLEEHYGKRGTMGGDLKYELTPEYNALFNAMGTQRSSRSNEIRRPYEFLYEIFAQYLGTGKVTFNPLPANLAYGRKAWGNPTKYMNIKPEYKEETDRHQIADQLAYDMELMFNDVMSQMVGKILVM